MGLWRGLDEAREGFSVRYALSKREPLFSALLLPRVIHYGAEKQANCVGVRTCLVGS